MLSQEDSWNNYHCWIPERNLRNYIDVMSELRDVAMPELHTNESFQELLESSLEAMEQYDASDEPSISVQTPQLVSRSIQSIPQKNLECICATLSGQS